MTYTMNGHFVPRHVTEGPRQEAPDTERALLELEADVLGLVDETHIRTLAVDNGTTVTPTTHREDNLGRRLRRSVMFADVRNP